VAGPLRGALVRKVEQGWKLASQCDAANSSAIHNQQSPIAYIPVHSRLKNLPLPQ
jgi:hypothetical protein